ncbi:MAG: serine hydrolase domain-containing protein, partial [Myxococcota bacterium]|jgi:CubicO group peptidase (beta-lactamase class C family)|nr:serine hydrolase domain-containing protein [Myxococcota bacterium]
VLVLQAVERGELALEGAITRYLPDYREDTGSRVTVHHLLSHTAGIPEYLGALFADPSQLTRTYAPKDFVTRFCSADLAFEPGEKFAYSNSNYFILGAILEAVTKKTYAQLVAERIFKPAGMTASDYEQPRVIKTRRARGYSARKDGGDQNAPYYDLSVAYAAGALTSTVDDLLAFDQALDSETLLTKASVAKLWTPVTANYGYGWEVYEKPLVEGLEPITITGHAGSTFGFHSNLLRVPSHKALVVVLSNTQPAKVREFGDALMTLLLSQETRR